MAGLRRAKARKILAAQFVQRAQKIVPIAQPCGVAGNHRRAVAVGADPKRIAPLAAAADIDGSRWRTVALMLVATLRTSLPPSLL